jgi:hypothetical protein
MHEFTTVSASSYDPAALAAKLTEKSAEGWSVVSIVSTGGDVTAFLSKAAAGAEAAAPAAEAAPVAAAAAAAVAEPAGWAAAPEAAAPAPAPAPAPVAAAAATPAIPADWYADPSGRFELRYWNGSAWTEHVARAGQQYTDPPVA